MDRQLIGEADAFLWPSREGLKVETEIMAAQDRELQTKYHATLILQTEKEAANADYDNRLM